ncbi:hypothetical protein M3Y99_01468600 [Aphelenchoides fujianensis]|nr:hypothetical protein M3Y99_01468600 [Aphelenchoides fujianensis]
MTPFSVAIVLGVVNLLVVCGNMFVLYILVSQKSLHTSTNFISAIFLLGVVVLPFSIFQVTKQPLGTRSPVSLQEYSDSWMFGAVWCKAWLALDVLFSTASIYSLLAISFDRYMAVRQPIKYRFISSNRMTKITIALVWLISMALAFPPLVYDHFGQLETPVATNWTAEGELILIPYILFSAFVSFILPMILMVGLNLSIFHTVADSTKLTKIQSNGCNTANGTAGAPVAKNSEFSATDDTQSEIVHIGQRSASMVAASMKKVSMLQRDMIRKPTFDHSFSIDRDTMSLASTDTGALIKPPGRHQSAEDRPTTWLQKMKKSSIMEQRSAMVVELDRQSFHSATSTPALYPYPPAVLQKSVVDQVWYPAVLASMVAARRGTKKTSERLLLYPMLNFGRFNLRTELRVARTIGVVVGVFTICWFPFTIIYLLQFEKPLTRARSAFALAPWMFTVAFWLGYANSALNPLLYAAFSRDFRSAFRKVLTDRNSSFRSF